VVLVHATGFCAAVWAPLASLLTDVRIVALDVRGHGQSSSPAGPMAWQGTADDVLAVVNNYELRNPVGIGHSMGGASLVLAEEALPETFAGLWLFEPVIFPPNFERPTNSGNRLSDGARRRRSSFASAEEALANYSSKPPMSSLSIDALTAYVEFGFDHHPDGSVSLRCQPEVEASTYEMGAEHTAFARLAEVACPTVVLRGRDDVPGPASFSPVIASGLSDGMLEEHPELGHFGPLENPAAMAASAQRLIDRAASRTV